VRTSPPAILELIRSDEIASAFVWLLDFGLSDGTHLRYARYVQDVTYLGNVYSSWPWEGGFSMGGKGNKIPTVSLTIADGARILRPYALATNWFRNCTLASTIVCVDLPAVDYSTVTWTWDIQHAAPQGDAITLTLGGTNISKVRFPAEQYFAWQCPFARGFPSDPRCAYSGSETTCNGTFSRCVELANQVDYGGWLGLDPGAAKLVVPIFLRGLG
jgi:hypothetical protein